MIKGLKILVVVVVVYAGVVVAFESLLGLLQPQPEATFVLRTFDAEGEPHERVVSRIESDGRLYVAANHWPRAWYRRALEQPEVEVTADGETRAYRAVPVAGAEHERVDAEHALGPFFRILTGFPPRRFVRLDPR